MLYLWDDGCEEGSWYILAHHDGNSRVDRIQLGPAHRDPSQPPSVADLAAHFGPGYWPTYQRTHHGLCLIFAANSYDAHQAYKRAGRRATHAA